MAKIQAKQMQPSTNAPTAAREMVAVTVCQGREGGRCRLRAPLGVVARLRRYRHGQGKVARSARRRQSHG